MPHSLRLLAGAIVAAFLSLALLPDAALSASKGKSSAFNPQPDPPGKRVMPKSKSLGGPDTKGSWKRIHEVDEKSKRKGGTKSLPAVQKSKNPK
jgi:hypothetical protein